MGFKREFTTKKIMAIHFIHVFNCSSLKSININTLIVLLLFWVESEFEGFIIFSRIMDYFRLGYGVKECPAGSEPPAVLEIEEKLT